MVLVLGLIALMVSHFGLDGGSELVSFDVSFDGLDVDKPLGLVSI